MIVYGQVENIMLKKEVLIQNIENGGLKMPYIDAMTALKLTWINRLLNDRNNFSLVAQAVTGISDFQIFFTKKLDLKYIDQDIPIFYKQLLGYWFAFHGTDPSSINEILNESLWENRRILVGGKPLLYPKWKTNGIQIIYDVINSRGEILSWKEIQRKVKARIDIMQYNSLISAIPGQWLRTVKQTPNYVFKRVETIQVKINKVQKDIAKVKCKDFYWETINKRKLTPKCIEKWDEIYITM